MGVENKHQFGNKKNVSFKNWKSSRRRLTNGTYTFKEMTNICQRPKKATMRLICTKPYTFTNTYKNILFNKTKDWYILLLCLFIIFACNAVTTVEASDFQDGLRNVIASPPLSESQLAARYTDRGGNLNIDTRVKRFSETDEDYGYDYRAESSGYPGIDTDDDYGRMLSNKTFMDLRKLYLGPVCALIDVRNSPFDLKDMENCTVINGFVHILFMHDTKESDFEKYSFPKLRVITEYLLIYRVYGLRSLQTLFPNLAVIGGRKVFYKYGMVIYENPQLEELGLENLRYIERGSVRIQKNTKLCYLNTIDWKRLGMLGNKVINDATANPVIKDNTVPGDETCLDQCGEEGDCLSSGTNGDDQYCWGHKICQKPSCPKECPNACMDTQKDQCQCHEECLAGCTAPRNASACLACRKKSHDGVCVAECPEGTFLDCEVYIRKKLGPRYTGQIKYRTDTNENNWRCLTRAKCQELTWIPHNGKCIFECPPDHEELVDIDGNYCKYCGNDCRHDCNLKDEYMLTDSDSIDDIYGCTSIKGRLVINILADDDLLESLEVALRGIEEVGALVIRRSESLLSLGLLRNLKRITGIEDALVDGTYCLYVLDNSNLRELFPTTNDSSTGLQIGSGKAFFHFNPRLCMKEIDKISALTTEVEDNQDISETTNGDRATCDMKPLEIIGIENMPMGEVEFATARIKWKKVDITDPRTLIGYQVYYRKSKYKNATRYEGLYACGKSSSWLVKDLLVSPREASLEVNDSSKTDAVLHNLKPFTQYAFYVKTYTTSTAQRGAQSEINYFMTEPSKPTEPVDLTATPLNTTAIHVEWKPPVSPNGNITHYIVRWRRQRENIDLIKSVDMCKGKPSVPTKAPKTINMLDLHTTKAPPGTNEKCCSCDTKEILPSHEEEAYNNLNFEKFLHKKMFKVQFITMDPDYLSNDNKRKRSIFGDSTTRQMDNSTGDFTTPSSVLDILNNTDFSTSTPEPEESKKDKDYEWNFSTEVDTFITLKNLHHFSEYEIQVFACNHASEQPNGFTYEYIKSGMLSVRDAGCGIDSITAMRCQRQPTADVIPPESFKLAVVELDNDRTHPAFVWEPPPDPNGYVKYYTIDIQQKTDKDFKSADERCFSLDKFEMNHGIFTMPTALAPGTYRGRVMTVTLAGKGEWTDFLTFDIPELVGVGPKVTEKYLWTVAIAAAVIIVLLIFSSVYYFRKKKQVEARNAMIYSSANPEYVSLAANYIPDGYEVEEDDVDLLKLIGHGNFGKVFMGYARKVIKGEEKTQVAIKKLHEKSSIHKRIEFLEEAKLMKAFNSTHVVRLLGVVSQTIDPMVIMEYMERGDLKSHLRSRRADAEHETENFLPPPTLQEKLEMAAEIADGMAYLSEIKYVHRDLAARNCLVSVNGVVKIGDFGLTRDVYETDYYRKDSRGLLPIRWMAPESLRDGVFDSSSDVWSYGVVIWEIATLAEQPYRGLQHDHVTRHVIDGGYMEKPKDCPKKLYDLMLNCWEFNPEMRPKFTEILASLANDVTERFRQESFYYENKRAKLKPTDEEISLLNGDVIISREGSFRIATPITLTPSRSRSETPCGCHTPSSRNSNGSTKAGSELFFQCEHLKKNDSASSNLYTPNGKVGGLAHSASMSRETPGKRNGNIPKSESFTQKLFRKSSPHLKKTPPSTLSHRGDDLYYSLSTSGIEDDIGDDAPLEEVTSPKTNNDVKINNHINKNSNPVTENGNDITYAWLSNNQNAETLSKTNGIHSKPYAHMNGFVKRTNSPRQKSRRTPVPQEESSYVESSPKHSNDVTSVPNSFQPMKVPPPPTSTPPFPSPNQPLIQS